VQKRLYRILCDKVGIRKLFLRVPMNPVYITILWCITVCIAAILFTFNNYFLSITAAILLHLYLILDYVDGEIARERGEMTNFLKVLDLICHRLADPLPYIGIAYGLYETKDYSIFLFPFLILISMSLIELFKSSSIGVKEPVDIVIVSEKRGNRLFRAVKKVLSLMVKFGFKEFCSTIILVFAILNTLFYGLLLATIIYLFAGIGVTVYNLLWISKENR